MPPPTRAAADETGLEELLRTLGQNSTRPHGRAERFEDSYTTPDCVDRLSDARRLQLGPLIGEGGMGRVHLATQAVLEREVAVKTLRAAATRSGSPERFLQEARATGMVEHPNVVPVYDLVVTEDGALALVMKRIAGVPWGRTLREPERLPKEEAGDPLAWHLRVLMALCDAVHYAHEIGVVHRDIKPDNVMIGDLGEIYLLDWGLAVSMREEDAGFIALARESTGLVGTPVYMAPEMARADSAAIGPATDVYLLGATLHEIVTGAPPHEGEDLYATVRQAFESRPHEYDRSVPWELADICRRAMAREPRDRFGSVAELRDALERFTMHRESHALAQTGREALAELEQRIDASPDADAAIEDLFGAVRFSLGQAIQLWPGNDDAKDAWEEALRRMTRYELSRERVVTAAALLAEQSEPDPEMTAELARLRERRERREVEVDQLRRLQREHDPAVSEAIRSRVALGLGVAWFAITAGAGRLDAWGVIRLDAPMFMAGAVLMLVMIGGLVIGRRELLANRVNRRIITAMTAGAITALYGRIVAVVYAQDVGLGFAREQLVYAMVAALVAIVSDLRILVAAAAFSISAALSAQWPHLAFEIGGLGVLAAMSWVSFVWRVSR